MISVRSKLYVKIGVIVIIVLLLLIPSMQIQNIIHEREYTHQQAISEVSGKWGNEQTISGPILSIPVSSKVKTIKGKDTIETITPNSEYIHILPNTLKITGDINPERRYRGIYEVVVYDAMLHFSGSFGKINTSLVDTRYKQLNLDKAIITVGIDDLRGIEEQVGINWNGNNLLFNPGVITNDLVESGINCIINFSSGDSSFNNFYFDLKLKGSQYLYFTPLGKTTDVMLNSVWKNPSFNGAFLPDYRKVSNTGFTANWNILHLNRNFPQIWTGTNASVKTSAFGVDLLVPVDNYQQSTRSVKYAILFIGLTFLAFFFIEIGKKVHLHPLQYILVGLALVIFFVLLVSISEHLNFNLAYLISAASVLLLIAGYSKAIFKSWQIASFVSGILVMLYTFIFVIIQLQDYALLMGSIGIFVILAFVMYFSRKIDWYDINFEHNKKD